MANEYIEYIHNCETGEITARPFTAEEIAQLNTSIIPTEVAPPTKEELLAKLLEIQAQLEGLK